MALPYQLLGNLQNTITERSQQLPLLEQMENRRLDRAAKQSEIDQRKATAGLYGSQSEEIQQKINRQNQARSIVQGLPKLSPTATPDERVRWTVMAASKLRQAGLDAEATAMVQSINQNYAVQNQQQQTELTQAEIAAQKASEQSSGASRALNQYKLQQEQAANRAAQGVPTPPPGSPPQAWGDYQMQVGGEQTAAGASAAGMQNITAGVNTRKNLAPPSLKDSQGNLDTQLKLNQQIRDSFYPAAMSKGWLPSSAFDKNEDGEFELSDSVHLGSVEQMQTQYKSYLMALQNTPGFFELMSVPGEQPLDTAQRMMMGTYVPIEYDPWTGANQTIMVSALHWAKMKRAMPHLTKNELAEFYMAWMDPSQAIPGMPGWEEYMNMPDAGMGEQ